MTNIRVNLIPKEIAASARARRQRAATGVAFLGLLAVLAVAQVVQLGRVSAAEEALRVEQDRLLVLQAEQRTLAEFAELDQQRTELTATIQTLLGGQVAVAGVLQDVAAVMPADAGLTTLNIGAVGGPDPMDVGHVFATADSLSGHSPGVERVLISFEKVAAFRELYVASSARADAEGEVSTGPQLTRFTFDFSLGPEVLSLRYVAGVPEGLR